MPRNDQRIAINCVTRRAIQCTAELGRPVIVARNSYPLRGVNRRHDAFMGMSGSGRSSSA